MRMPIRYYTSGGFLYETPIEWLVEHTPPRVYDKYIAGLTREALDEARRISEPSLNPDQTNSHINSVSPQDLVIYCSISDEHGYAPSFGNNGSIPDFFLWLLRGGTR